MVTDAPAQDPAKKLLAPEPPVPEIQLTMLVVLQARNTAAAADPVLPVSPVAPVGPCGPCGPCGPVAPTPLTISEPLTNRPVALTHKRLQPPGAKIAVQVIEASPQKPPRMMLHPLVVALRPALQPMNMFSQAVVLHPPA